MDTTANAAFNFSDIRGSDLQHPDVQREPIQRSNATAGDLSFFDSITTCNQRSTDTRASVCSGSTDELQRSRSEQQSDVSAISTSEFTVQHAFDATNPNVRRISPSSNSDKSSGNAAAHRQHTKNRPDQVFLKHFFNSSSVHAPLHLINRCTINQWPLAKSCAHWINVDGKKIFELVSCCV